MYISFVDKFEKAFNGKYPYGLAIEHGSFMLHIGFGQGLYLLIRGWEFDRFHKSQKRIYKDNKVIYIDL